MDMNYQCDLNILSAIPACIWDLNLVITMSADGLASNDARPATNTVLTTTPGMISSKFLHLLTHKQLEMHGYLYTTVATDALVLQHQAISIHSAD